jgi:prevent-host-death family protein
MLDIDLLRNVLPISKAASSLAALLKRARASGKPIIVTQKGHPTGVILDIATYVALAEAAEQGRGGLPFSAPFDMDAGAANA